MLSGDLTKKVDQQQFVDLLKRMLTADHSSPGPQSPLSICDISEQEHTLSPMATSLFLI